MFGFSFGEFMVLILVAIVVVGPRRLPEVMRTAGRYVAKLRRMTSDFRAQSGIDELIRQEGLEREIRELRALSRVNVIETLVTPVMGTATAGSVVSATPRAAPPPPPGPEELVEPAREREYPVLGCDAYGAELDEPAADEAEAQAAAPMAAAEPVHGAAS